MATATRKITVTSRTAVKTGESNGREWTLWEVEAVDANGDGIDHKLKTFDDLPVGKEVEVEAERQEHEKYGVSFMLKKKTGGLKGSVDELRARVERLEAQVAALGGARAPSSPAAAAGPPETAAGSSGPQSAASGGDVGDAGGAGGVSHNPDDDIPF